MHKKYQLNSAKTGERVYDDTYMRQKGKKFGGKLPKGPPPLGVCLDDAASRVRKEEIMEERIRQSRENHKKGYNCAQTVLCTYHDLLGVDEDILYRIAEGFGAGMGGRMETCGAVTGMSMAAGLYKSGGLAAAGQTTAETFRLVREMAAEFEQKNKSLICRELKGVDTKQVLRSCDGCVEDAVRIIGEKLFGLS